MKVKKHEEYEEYKPYEPYHTTIPPGLAPREPEPESETPHRKLRWAKVLSVPLLFISCVPLVYLLATWMAWDTARGEAEKAGTEVVAYTASPGAHPILILTLLLLSILTLGILLLNTTSEEWMEELSEPEDDD